MKRLLITGTSGFLGYNLCKDLQDNFTVFGTRHDAQPACSPADTVAMDLSGSLKPVEAFIGDQNIEAIIHCAAMSKAGPCSRNPDEARHINVYGTRGLAEIAARRRIPFIFISTDLVYNSGEGPHGEADADPHLVYSETKFDAELEAFKVCPRTVVLRAALIFGNDDGVRGSFLRDNEQDLGAGKTLTLFTDQYRTPVWSRDIAAAIRIVIDRELRSQVFNIGGDTRINRYDLGLKVAKIFGWNSEQMVPVAMETVTSDAPYMMDCTLDSSRFMKIGGWTPTPLDKALTAVAGAWNSTGK